MPPLLSLSGDLSKVQWPAALQSLNLQWCGGIEGTFQLRLVSFVRPTNTIEHLSCGPSRKADILTRFLIVCFCLVGDLGKIQWPASLQHLDLSGDYDKEINITGKLS